MLVPFFFLSCSQKYVCYVVKIRYVVIVVKIRSRNQLN